MSKLSTSSIRYEVGVFRKDATEAAAHGHFVHVFVDPVTRRPVPIPSAMRDVVARELVSGAGAAAAGAGHGHGHGHGVTGVGSGAAGAAAL